MSIEKRLKRDFVLFDLFFVPSSLIRLKLGGKKEKYWHYIPILLLEGARLGYYILKIEDYLR